MNKQIITAAVSLSLAATLLMADTATAPNTCTLTFSSTGDTAMTSFYGDQLLSVLQSSGYNMQDGRAACCALEGLGANTWTPPVAEVGGAWGLQTAQQFANNAGLTAHASWKGKRCNAFQK